MVPRLLPQETYGETWTAIADLQDGTYVKVQLNLTNLGPGQGNAYCRTLIARPNQPVQQAHLRGPWSAEPGALRVGPCSMVWRPGHLAAVAPLEGHSVRLKLRTRHPRFTPPDSRVRSEGGLYVSDILLPPGRAQAVLVVGSGEPHSLRGGGYADHSVSTLVPGRIARRWVRFRALRGHNPTLLLVRYPPGDASPRGWTWQNGHLHRLTNLRLFSHDTADRWRLQGQLQNEPFRFSTGHRILRSAPVEALGALSRVARALVGNPVTSTFRARLELPAQHRLSGIAEVARVEP